MKASAATRFGLVCPTDPSHGLLIPNPGDETQGWYCPNQAHDGRSDKHKDGPIPPTRSRFTTEEAEAQR